VWLLILQEMLGFLVMMLIGALAARCRLITDAGLDSMNTLAQKVFLPIMVFTFTYRSLSIDALSQHWQMMPLAACFYSVTIVLTHVLSKALRLSGAKASAFRMVFTFGNTGFIGLPMLSTVFAESGVVNLLMFMVVDQLVLWTYGIREASKPSSRPSVRKSLRGLFNPNIIAFALGFAVTVVGVDIPPFVEGTLESLGAVASPFCMVCLGCLCLSSKMGSVLAQPELYAGIAIKMVALPIACMPLLLKLDLGGDIVPSLLLMMAMPTTTLVPLVVASEGGDRQYATRMSIATIVASTFTVPLIAAVIGG
jgi:predicted permease